MPMDRGGGSTAEWHADGADHPGSPRRGISGGCPLPDILAFWVHVRVVRLATLVECRALFARCIESRERVYTAPSLTTLLCTLAFFSGLPFARAWDTIGEHPPRRVSPTGRRGRTGAFRDWPQPGTPRASLENIRGFRKEIAGPEGSRGWLGHERSCPYG